MKRTILPILMGALLLAPMAQATMIDHHDAAMDGADRLLEIQHASGAFPWIVDDSGEFQNVQGVTAQGLLDAYRVSGEAAYLEAAGETVAWLDAELGPDDYSSAPNAYFLAEYALLTQDLDALTMARQGFENAVEDDRWDDTPTALAEAILEARVAQGHTNLGLWDVALFVRAAQDIGYTDAADELAAVLVEQANQATIVDPFDEDAAHYELGLAALLFGLSEADVAGHLDVISQANQALQAEQGDDGSIPGDIYGDVQVTAYAALGFVAIGELAPATAACGWLAQAQEDNGGWLADGTEYGETDSEAVQALATCVLPARNGATAYGDAAVGLL